MTQQEDPLLLAILDCRDEIRGFFRQEKEPGAARIGFFMLLEEANILIDEFHRRCTDNNGGNLSEMSRENVTR